MRVASRRLRAAMDAYQSACKPKLFKKTYQQVKQVADLLGTARDTDVMVQHIKEQMEQSEEKGGTQWLLNRLSSCRKQQQRKLEAFLIDFDEQRFQQQLADSIRK
jgi:CHAD domain-containing protein